MKGYELARVEVHLKGDETTFGGPRVITIYNTKKVTILEGINALFVEEICGDIDDPHHHIAHHNFPLQNVLDWQRVWFLPEAEDDDDSV